MHVSQNQGRTGRDKGRFCIPLRKIERIRKRRSRVLNGKVRQRTILCLTFTQDTEPSLVSQTRR
jgi:hypothetical protein